MPSDMTDLGELQTNPIDDARRALEPVADIGIAPPGWRLPGATRLGHVSLQIADLSRSLPYYQQVLGLDALERTDGSVLLGTADGRTPLVQLTEQKGARAVPQHGRLGLYHFAILLPDRASLGRYVQYLAEIGVRAGASDHLVSEALYLRDPDGLGIEVYADRPRRRWRAVDRQLQMATDPLDLEDVINAGGGEPWAGMPAGTTMGHMHLHVGNLDQATAFYHVALGLDKMVWSYPGALFLASGGYHHHLGVNTWAGAQAPQPTSDDARLLEWRVILPSQTDVRGAVDSFSAGGYAAREDEGSWITTDPWNTAVRLVSG